MKTYVISLAKRNYEMGYTFHKSRLLMEATTLIKQEILWPQREKKNGCQSDLILCVCLRICHNYVVYKSMHAEHDKEKGELRKRCIIGRNLSSVKNSF